MHHAFSTMFTELISSIPYEKFSSSKSLDLFAPSKWAYLPLGLSIGLSTCFIASLSLRSDVFDCESPWMAELITLYVVFGGFAAAVLMQFYGRVRVIQWATLALASAWTIACLSEVYFTLLYVGTTFATGALSTLAPSLCVHVIEIHSLEYNHEWPAGTIILTGILLSYVLVFFVPTNLMLYLLPIVTIVSYASLRRQLFDSPIWLVSKMRYVEASSACARLGLSRASDPKALEGRDIAARQNDQKTRRMSRFKFCSYVFFQQVTGNHLWYYYMMKVGFSVDVTASMGHVLLTIVPSLVISDVLNKAFRRSTFLLSTFVVCVTYLIAAVYQYVFETAEDDVDLFVYACSLINCIFGHFAGAYSLSWILAVENTPTEIRGFQCGVLWLANFLVLRLWLQTYQWSVPLIEAGDESMVCLTLAVITALFYLRVSTDESRSRDRKSSLEMEIGVLEDDSARTEDPSCV